MTNIVREISVAKDFSPEPAGRTKVDGPFSAEDFRERVLAPALMRPCLILVNLDGTVGYASSFLEETFGGLVREHGFVPENLRRKMRIISEEDPTLILEIDQYLDEAHEVRCLEMYRQAASRSQLRELA